MALSSVMLQKVFRGYRSRRRFEESRHLAERHRDERRLQRLVARAFRGYLHGRRPARQLRAERDAQHWAPRQWEAVLADSGWPDAPARIFAGETGCYQAFRLKGSLDVTFYRNAKTGDFMWEQPPEWQAKDRSDSLERQHIRAHGFSAAQARAVTKIQKFFRGCAARERVRLVTRAQRICKGAEVAYLADPEDRRCQINYILYTHAIRKDYERSRDLYARALADMERRGPDIQLLLYAFAIFCFVTREEDTGAIIALVERAIVAERGAATVSPLPATVTLRRKPKKFTLAEAGFFRFAAYTIGDAESWHNYAACRQLVYGDFDGATECYLKALEIDPRSSRIEMNYQTLLDWFPQDSDGATTFESLRAHNVMQIECKMRRGELEFTRLLTRSEVKQAALRVERAWIRRKQYQMDTYKAYLGPKAALLSGARQDALKRENAGRELSKGLPAILRKVSSGNYLGQTRREKAMLKQPSRNAIRGRAFNLLPLSSRETN